MRTLLKNLCAFGVVVAVTAPGWAREVRSHEKSGSAAAAKAQKREVNSNPSKAHDSGAASTVSPGGIPYDASGAPYSRGQSNFDSSNDFQLPGD